MQDLCDNRIQVIDFSNVWRWRNAKNKSDTLKLRDLCYVFLKRKIQEYSDNLTDRIAHFALSDARETLQLGMSYWRSLTYMATGYMDPHAVDNTWKVIPNYQEIKQIIDEAKEDKILKTKNQYIIERLKQINFFGRKNQRGVRYNIAMAEIYAKIGQTDKAIRDK